MADEYYTFETFKEEHSPQLVASGVPRCLWKAAYDKLSAEVFDAGDSFQIIQEEVDSGEGVDVSFCVQSTCQLQSANPSSVFLIDHAWTFRLSDAREQLDSSPSLLERMAALTGVVDEPGRVDAVLARMWPFCQTYSVKSRGMDVEAQMPVWYLMDEFGCRIGHADAPTARIVPLYYIPKGISFSLLYLLQDLDDFDEVTRDYLHGPQRRGVWRHLYMLPWSQIDCSHLSQAHVLHDDDFYQAHRETVELAPPRSSPSPPSGRPLRVFADESQLTSRLTDPSFEVVAAADDADVFWLRQCVTDYKKFAADHPDAFINQFPNENVLTVKDLLAAVVQQTCDLSTPQWLKETYNLSTELPQFVAHFQSRQKDALDNHWIVKPCNLARSLDTHVTNSLAQIIRLTESGPKIACKYVERPVLFYRPDRDCSVKFDLRFIVYLRSVEPLQLYVYNKFWLRFAVGPFSLDEPDDNLTHFTVFNYSPPNDGESLVLDMTCEQFVDEFQRQYPEISWEETKKNIYEAIGKLFRAATSLPQPRAVAPNAQSRALYGVDVMLERTDSESMRINPVCLEVNYYPDCERACQYYEDFANTSFATLFLRDDQIPLDKVDRLI